MNVTEDIRYIGVNDHELDLFEGQYAVPNGMAYNSYVILDEKTAVIDTADVNFTDEWMGNLAAALAGRKPDYLVVQHMEPDHSASIPAFLQRYPGTTVVASAMAFMMLGNYYPGNNFPKIVSGDGVSLPLGKHVLHFVSAPMVHWPEVVMTYDSTDKVFFSADAFGKFGALDAEEEWDCEARRYYFGIVGKYGQQVQTLLKKASALDIRIICPLHGPVLTENLSHYLNLYSTWSLYRPEDEGVLIAYTSVYGHTKEAALLLAAKIAERSDMKVAVCDLAREDMAEAVEDAFRYSKLVLATTTYNMDIFPPMRSFIEHLTERLYQNRTVGLIENGSWAPAAAGIMKKLLAGCRNITWLSASVTIRSSMTEANKRQIEAMAAEIAG